MSKLGDTDKLALEIRTHEATREALDFVSEIFEKASTEKKLSRTEFAEIIGRDPSYLARVLNGRVSNVNYQTIARLLIGLGYWPMLTAEPIEGSETKSNYMANTVEFPSYGVAGTAPQAMNVVSNLAGSKVKLSSSWKSLIDVQN